MLWGGGFSQVRKHILKMRGSLEGRDLWGFGGGGVGLFDGFF